jgi:uncharacterized protein (UPF0276 family)
LNNKSEKSIFQGVGINLRLDFIDEVIELKPKIPFLEIIVDNWLSVGPHHKKLEILRQDYQLSFHSVGMNLCGTDEINQKYLNQIKTLKEKYQPIHISDHLCVTANNNRQHHDLLPFPYTEEYLANTIERVNFIQDFFNETILVENLSFYLEFQSSQMSEIEFLNKLNKKTNCSNLLDLNNIWVNQKNLDLSVDDYLREVDWSNVKEIHLAGPELINGVFVDTHGSDIYPELMSSIIKHKGFIRSIPTLYERDNNFNGIEDLLNQKNILDKEIYE